MLIRNENEEQDDNGGLAMFHTRGGKNNRSPLANLACGKVEEQFQPKDLSKTMAVRQLGGR